MKWRKKPAVPTRKAKHRVCLLTEMRAWEAAVEESSHAVAREPENAHLYAHMAQALLALNRNDEALRAADAAVRLAPNRQWHHGLRSMSLSKLHRDEEALRSAEESLRLSPESTFALHRLANCQGRCLQWTEMLRTARRFERLAPDVESPHHLRGEALWGLGDVEGAYTAFQKALSIDPRCPELHTDLGHVLLVMGQIEDATESFLQSLRLLPTLEVGESGLMYAVRRYLDAIRSSPRGEAADGSSAGAAREFTSVLGTQLHVLALRVPAGYRRLFKTWPPAIEYRSFLSEEDVEETNQALHAWQFGSCEEDRRALTELRLPTELAHAFIQGRTGHYPEGLGIRDMIRHWMTVVLELERGYPRDNQDFQHDLGVRDAVEAIAGRTSPRLHEKILDTLEPWDARFLAATVEAPDAGPSCTVDGGWWWTRVPGIWVYS